MPEGDPTPPADGGQGGNSNDKESNGSGWKPPASPEEFNRIIESRLARERGKFGDYDDLKAKAAKLEEIEAASASDLEKAIKRAEDAEAKAKTAGERATASALRAAVVAEASRAGAVDPEAVLAMLPKDVVTVGDDGQVTGVEDAVKALLESKKYLVGTPPPPPKAGSTGSAEGGARGDQTGGQLTRDDLKSMSHREITKAKAEGRLNDVLGVKA